MHTNINKINSINITKKNKKIKVGGIDNNEFSIMTFNIYENNCDINKFNLSEKPDIICTQEDSINNEFKKDYERLYNCGEGNEKVGVYYLKTLFDKPVYDKCVETTTTLLGCKKRNAILFKYKNYKIANLHLEGGRFVSNNLNDSNIDNYLKYKIKLLNEVLKEKPDIILGDFNSVYSENITLLETFMKGQIEHHKHIDIDKIKKWNSEAFEILKKENYNYLIPNNESNLTTNSRGSSIIDTIWVNNKINGFNTNIINLGLKNDEKCFGGISDHNPVYTKISPSQIYKEKMGDNITTIKGPLSCNYFKFICPNGEEKKIIIFGEHHSTSPECPNKRCDNILNFMTNLISETDKNGKCVDFFIEQSLKENQGYHTLAIKSKNDCCDLENLRNYLMNCNTWSGSKCKINGKERNNVRVQNFDLRFYNNRIFILLIQLIKTHDTEKLKIKFKNNDDKEFYIEFCLGYHTSDSNKKNFLRIIRNIFKKKFPTDFDESKFNEEIDLYLTKINKEYSKFLKNKDNFLPKGSNDLREELNKYFKKIIKLDSKDFLILDLSLLITDFYLLLRLFNQFDMKGPKNRGPLKCRGDENKNLNNIIIYSGLAHSEVYIKILLKYYPDSLQFSTISTAKSHKNQIQFGETSVQKNILGFTNFNQLIADFSRNKSKEFKEFELFLSKIDDNNKILTQHNGFIYAVINYKNILYLVSDYFYHNTNNLITDIDKKDVKNASYRDKELYRYKITLTGKFCPKFNTWLSTKKKISELFPKSKLNDLIKDIKILGRGIVHDKSDSSKKSHFGIVESKKINRFLKDKGFSHESLHITLGFTDKDIREEEANIKKNKDSIIPELKPDSEAGKIISWGEKLKQWENGIGLPKPQNKNFFWITSGYKDDNSVYQEYYISDINNDLFKDSDESSYDDEIKANSGKPQIRSFGTSAGTYLIIPKPKKGKNYAHINLYLKKADEDDKKKFFKHIVDEIRYRKENNQGKTYWINTHGLGVPYLHIRMDQGKIKYIPSDFDDYFLKGLLKKSISDYRNGNGNGNGKKKTKKKEVEILFNPTGLKDLNDFEMILNNSNNYNIPKSNSKYDKLDAYLKYCDRVQNAYIEKHGEVTKLYNYIRVIQDEDPNVSLNQINISALINYLDNIIKSTDIKEKDLKKKKKEQKKWKKENEKIMKKLLKDFDIKKMREATTPTRKKTPVKTNTIKKTKKQKREEMEKYKKYETIYWGGNEDKSIYFKALFELENSYNLEYINEEGDGDCLFRALDRIDKGNINIDPTDFKNIRNQIGDFIKNNVLNSGSISEEQKKQIIEAIIFDGKLEINNSNKKNNEIDVNHMIENNKHIKYVKIYIKQIKSTKWGGDIEILIWGILKSKCINVFRIYNNNLLLFNKCSQPIKDCINLFFHNKNHYGSLHNIKS
uniref:OTU domain-containing protein n=1 Tax=Mimiviridae sp. ChoanoV1 TaxID=2596887 RepID=A0A5B8HWZ4_9VIRU|nr:hypothetical protein 7_10 [Mimiviridae sp. ChoanoV1]